MDGWMDVMLMVESGQVTGTTHYSGVDAVKVVVPSCHMEATRLDYVVSYTRIQ